MRYDHLCVAVTATTLGMAAAAAMADPVVFTSRANGAWNLDATWNQVPDPDPSDATHLWPRLGDTANISHNITLALAQEATALNLSAGTIGLGTNTLTLHGASTWTAGTFAGAGGTLRLNGSAAALALSSAIAKTLSAGTLDAAGAELSLSAGSLVVNGSMIDLSGGGGGTLSLLSTSAFANFNSGTRVRGGAVGGGGTINIGSVVTLDSVNLGSVFVASGTGDTLTLKGSLTSAGTISVVDTGSGSAVLKIDGNVSLGGSGGRIILSGANNNLLTSTNATDVLTLGAGQTISGVSGATTASEVRLALENNGIVEADGAQLALNTYAKANNGVMRAVNAGTLHINSITLTNSSGTLTAAAGSTISLSSATVIGGRINGAGTVNVGSLSTLDGNGSGGFQIDGVTIAMNTGDTLDVKGTITNNGVIELHDNGGGVAQMRLAGDTLLNGSGSILFAVVDDNYISSSAPDFVLTVGPSQLLTTGAATTIDSQLRAAVANLGTIEANGGNLVLNTYGKTNQGVLRAVNGGTMEFSGITVANSAGTITAGAGSVVRLSSSSVIGGRIDGTGTIDVNGTGTIDGATAGGVRLDGVTVEMNTGDVLRVKGSITNNGLIELRDTGGSTAQMYFDGDTIIDGNGTILFAVADDQLITTAAEANVLTLGPGQFVTTGPATTPDSQIRAHVTNQGIIEANQGRLVLNTYSKSNQNVIRARGGGTLEIAATTVNNSGTITAEAGSFVQLNGGTIAGGRIGGAGRIDIAGAATLDATAAAMQLDGPVVIDMIGGESLTLLGDITNNATLQLRDTGTGTARLLISGNRTISGSGTILFAGAGNNYLAAATTGDVLTLGASQTISTGPGTIDSQVQIGLINNGIIEAVGGVLLLSVNPKTNQGIVRGGAGGDLTISGTSLTNSGAGTIQVLAGGRMTVEGSGTLTTSGLNNDGTLTVNAAFADVGNLTGAGTVVLIAGSASRLNASHIRQTQLTINTSSAKATINPNGGPAGTSVLNALSIAGSGKLDLTNNDLIVDYADASPAGYIRGIIRTGCNAGAWNGGGIITSMGDAQHLGLGYGEAAALGLSQFDLQPVDATTVIVKYTYFGDANLDGQVDVIDLGMLATNWQMSGLWTEGDFNYDAKADVIDLGMLATNWQAGVGAPLGPGQAGLRELLESYGLPAVEVPEPLALWAALAVLGAHRRRRGAARMRTV